MKWSLMFRSTAAAQLAREIQRRGEQLERDRAVITAAAEARVATIAVERDWLRQRNEQLVDTIIAFKKDGFATPTRARVHQARDVEAETLARIEGRNTRSFIENATVDIMERTGASRADAEAEARRLREEAVSQHSIGA